MNPNAQNKTNTSLYNTQTKNIIKNKPDLLIKENKISSQQNNLINSYNFETENIYSNKKINQFTSNINKNVTQCNKDNFISEKNLNISTTQDLTRHFSGNKQKKKDISNLSILSPKTQKEILNLKGNNINDNLFEKNVNLYLNNQNFDSNCKFILINKFIFSQYTKFYKKYED